MNFTLPIPPSVNAMYRRNPHGFGLFKTKDAKAWIKECSSCIKVKKPLSGRVDVSINFYFFRDRDVDNCIKAVLDVLQEYGVVENDRQVFSVVATKAMDKENPRVEVSVIEND